MRGGAGAGGLGSGAAGRLARRNGRPRNSRARAGNSIRQSAEGGDYLRARDYRNRREGHQARSVRFSGEASHHRKSYGGGEERAAAAQARAGAGTVQARWPQPATDNRRKRADASAAPAARLDGG